MEDIARFLHEHPPFAMLDFPRVEALTRRIQIEYFAAQQPILQQGGPPGDYLYIIRRGSVDCITDVGPDEQITDTLGEGDIFDPRSLLAQQPPAFSVRTREEVLTYLLPRAIFERLCQQEPAFASQVSASPGERLDHALHTYHGETHSELYRLRMRDLQGPALHVPPYTTVQKAARLMREAGTSSVIVGTSPRGIVTDLDLRNRVLADALPDTVHVARVMSSPVVTLPADSLAFEGLLLMVRRNIHHVPITENSKIVGVVTHTELLRQQSRSPLLLPRLLQRARTLDDLRAYANQVESTAGMMLREGARVRDIARMVAIGHDALVVRLLEDAEAELGPPPCPYAWLVLGSQGRLEQTLRTDQDNALVYADNAPSSATDYFPMLAARVVEQLEACGFPRCPGDIMATNPTWCQPLRVWRSYFERWISVPDEDALLWAATFFDYRRVHGGLEVDTALHAEIGRSSGQRIFLGRMARAALRQSPPLGFFRDFVLESDGANRDLVDLKERGTALAVDLARIYALDAGSTETNTLGRLRAAAEASTLSASSAEELTAAFELINLFRLRHQYHQVEAGQEPTNLLSVSSLSKLEQRDLKDALRTLATNQRIVEHSFQVGLFA